MPAAADASTTAGGGTRNGASARTTTCAAGRKTYSASASVPSLAFLDRANALAKRRSLDDRARVADPRARLVDLAPRVPEEKAAWAPLAVDVCDDALAVRLVPGLDRLQPRVDLA